MTLHDSAALRERVNAVPVEELRHRMVAALLILYSNHYRSPGGYTNLDVMDACRQLEGSSPMRRID